MVRVSRAHYPVTALGPGSRLGIWVQGCTLACAGCMSRDTWEPSGGRDVSAAQVAAWWRAALSDGATGLTVSGGEPLQQAAALARLLDEADRIRRAESRPDADILLYTGYDEAEISALGQAAVEAVGRADAVITGRYRADRPTGLIWRGSANQRLTALTELGRARYAQYVDHVPEQPPVQVLVDDAGVGLIGVPPRGALGRWERELRAQGIRFEAVTWRP